MKEKLQGILQTAKEQLAAAKDSRALDEARVKFLGKKGELTALLKGMKDVAAEERPVVGQLINDVRAEIETIIDKQKKLIEQAALEKKLEAETIDVTLPGEDVVIGKKHPLNIVMSMKSSNITCAKDLKGKIIGYPGTVDNEYFVKAMMEHNGLSYDDVTMQDVGFDLNTSLISGNVDAVIGTYINHEYPALQKEGYDVTYFDITKEGCPDYEELVLVTGENQVKNESDKLARFIRASRKGFQDVLDDPQGCLQILLNNQDKANYPLDSEVEEKSMEILLPLMADNSADFLTINKESWQNTADWLLKMGIITKAADIDALVTDIPQ